MNQAKNKNKNNNTVLNASGKIFKQWSESSEVSRTYKRYIAKYNNEQINHFFANKKFKFGTAGVRAVMGPGTTALNRFTYASLAQAYGKYLISKFKGKQIRVVIGHDNRANSEIYSKLCADVLTSMSIEVFIPNNNAMLPTPIISFLVRELNCDGGIIITASHNPKSDNGFKVYNEEGIQMGTKETDAIEKLQLEPSELLNYKYTPLKQYIKKIGKLPIAKYFEVVKSSLVNNDIIEKKKFFPIIFTGFQGTTSQLLPKYLKSLKFINVIPVKEQCRVSESFDNTPIANPENPDAFALALRYAKKHNAQVMIGCDPDGDRFAMATLNKGKWHYYTGNEMAILMTYYILTNKVKIAKPFICASHVSTNYVDRIMKEYRGKVIRTGTGFKNIVPQINKMNLLTNQFIIAFEEAIGSLLTLVNRDKDGFQAAGLALEMYYFYKTQNLDLTDVLEKLIFPKYGYWFGITDSITLKGYDALSVIKKAMSSLRGLKVSKLGNKKVVKQNWNKVGDCLEWHLEDGSWVKFRASGTEPKFKVYYEVYGNSSNEVNKNFDLIKKDLRKIIKF